MNRAARRAAILVAFAGLAGKPAAGFAQTPPDAGGTLRELERPRLTLPPEPPAMPEKIEPPTAPAKADSTVSFTLRGVRITGNSAFQTTVLAELARDLIDQEVGFTDLNQVAERITRYYRERGYFLAHAYLPAQEIRDGVVQIAVLEGRYGKLVLSNRSRVKDSVVLGYAKPLSGQLVREGPLERKLLLIYDLSGVGTPKAALRAGEHTGDTDLVLELGESGAGNGSVGLDNYGNGYTGANRVSGELNVLSPSGVGDLLSARMVWSGPGAEYHRLGYRMPVGGDGLSLGAAYSASRYRLGKGFAALDANGDTSSNAANLAYPFVRSRSFNLYGAAGYERRAMHDVIGAIGSATDKVIHVSSITLTTDFRDAFSGVNAVSFSSSWGRLDIQSPVAQATDAATARTQGGYSKYTLSLVRLQSLTERESLAVSFSGQLASKNLDSSEKLSLGGPAGVRAYPVGEAAGDAGYLLRAELRRSLYRPSMPGTVQRFLFVDTGMATISHTPFAAGENVRRLSSLGVGANWEKAGDFYVQVAVAHKLGGAVATSDNDAAIRGWVQATKYFF